MRISRPACNQEFLKIPTLNKLNEVLEKENINRFGKSHELQKKLQEFQQNTNYLKEEVSKLQKF